MIGEDPKRTRRRAETFECASKTIGVTDAAERRHGLTAKLFERHRCIDTDQFGWGVFRECDRFARESFAQPRSLFACGFDTGHVAACDDDCGGATQLVDRFAERAAREHP